MIEAVVITVFGGIAGLCLLGSMATLSPETVAANVAETRGVERLMWRAVRYLQ